MKQVRQAIKEDRYPEFVQKFFSTLYHGDKTRVPIWAVNALKTVGIQLLEERQTVTH
jgi:queuine tRNA-ribosyltransferase catalytic subunit